GSAPVIERRQDARPADVIVAKVDRAAQLVSLELVAPARRHVARARYGVRPPAAPAPGAGLSVSDILLFDPPDSLPTQLAAALPYVRGSTVMHPRARVGLFWENSGRELSCARMRLPILVYHKIDRIPPGSRYPKNYVTPEQFAAQLAFLARHGYTSISFLDYLAYRRGERRLPRRVIILTFDDGY